MNKTTLISLLTGLGLLLVQTLSFAGVAFPSATGNQYVPDQILVKFKPGVAAAARAQMAQTYGAQAIQTLGNQPNLVLANLIPGQTVAQAVSAYSNDPNVAYAQPNYIYHALAVPVDPQYGQLWAAKNTGQTINSVVQGEGWIYPTNNPGTAGDDMNLESAWNVQTDCSTVVVAGWTPELTTTRRTSPPICGWVMRCTVKILQPMLPLAPVAIRWISPVMAPMSLASSER